MPLRALREPLSRIQPLTATAAARADKLNSADRADSQRIPPAGTPGYLVVNLCGVWKAGDHVTLHAGLENLLDQAHCGHGSGSNEPGFGATVGFDVRF
jgi:hemoglobin/transferrin/lactoferrin receptor protein